MAPPKGHAPYKGCETGGAPKIYTEQFINNEADKLLEWLEDKQNIFIEDFCYERGYHDSRVPEFAKVNDKFSYAHSILKMRQRSALFKGGLNRKLAHPMCALILSHFHNIHSKTETTVTNNNQDSLKSILEDIDGETKDLIQ